MGGCNLITLVRSLFVLSYSMFWGGLTCYAGFVLRINHQVIVDPMLGGLITQRVTVLLQLLGAITVVLMLANAFQVSLVCQRYAFWLAFWAIVLGVALGGLVIVHRRLDTVIDIDALEVINREVFDRNHRRYNQLTTIEWIASLIYLPTTIAAWQKVDRQLDRTA